jgi:hypothetical protein
MTTRSDLCYVAGLFEGEGMIAITKAGPGRYRLLVAVANTDRQLIDLLVGYWPCGVSTSMQERRRRSWTWSLTNSKAERFIRQLLPHVRTRRVRQKAELALRFRQHTSRDCTVNRAPTYKSEQTAFYVEMRTLNRRGRAT